MLEHEGNHYLEVPYRTLSHPAIPRWEQRWAISQLRERGRDQVNEDALFRMIVQMRAFVTSTRQKTRKTRRELERRQHLEVEGPSYSLLPPETDASDRGGTIRPFEQIEEW